jgi:hypothetical protein
VVLVDVQIALGRDPQVHRPMLRQQSQHVIKETDSRANVGLT